MRGSMFTGGGGSWEREEHDYYATPSRTTMLLLDKLQLSGSIYEPACGEGHISKVLEEYYPNVKIHSTDLIDRGYGTGGVDFLNHDYGDWKVDNIITNPPFKFSKEFVEKSLELANDKVVMLMKIQFLESQGRKEFLENSPLKYVYCFSERQATMRNGWEVNPNTNKPWSTALFLAWFVWEKGYTGEPIIRWI